MKKSLLTIFSLFFFFLFAKAHESRPLYIKISEDVKNFTFEVNLPNTVDQRNLPLISLNSNVLNDNTTWVGYAAGIKQKWISPKDSLKLKGAEIGIKYPAFNPVISTIIALVFEDGEEQMLIIPPNENKITILIDPDSFEVRKQYTWLGMEHIWAGIDHLLFVVCLLIVTGFSRKLFVTITGFTIAHSITLVLSALEIIKLPIPPIEATIALSIVFLCYEIIHHHDQKKSLTYRYPIVVASSFGLLHGLGFAAVLGAIGLPKNHTTEALLFFNVGVELGQIIFIVVLYIIVGLSYSIGKWLLDDSMIQKIRTVGLQFAIYGVGVLASYWMFDRIL